MSSKKLLKIIINTVFLISLLWDKSLYAYQYRNGFYYPQTRKEAFFDKNMNGVLEEYERNHIKSYLKNRWELVDRKDKIVFDLNGDQMLAPYELKQYLKAKKEKKKPGM